MIILKYKFLFVVKKNYLLIFLLFKNFYIYNFYTKNPKKKYNNL